MKNPEVKTGELPLEPPTTAVMIPQASPLDLLQIAVSKLGGEGTEAVVNAIERLADLQLKIRAIDAEAEFNKDLAEFQAECPPIIKNKATKGAKDGGTGFGYTYTSLDEIERTVRSLLTRRGFSYSWNSTPAIEANKIVYSCTLRHKNGHQISTQFTVPISKPVASANDIQNHAALLTYGKRQTLIQVLGLSTTDTDTDGNPVRNLEKINKEQVDELTSKIARSGRTVQQFCKFMQIESLGDLTRGQWPTAMLALRGTVGAEGGA
jgi:hypothetical protein